MEIEALRSAINEALKSLSAETIAKGADGITAKSVLNFAQGAVMNPQRAQRQSLERWVASAGSGYVRKGTRGASRMREPAPPAYGASVGQLSVDGSAAGTVSGDELIQLATIAGYARAVLDMMRAVTDQQAQVVSGLMPWVQREVRGTLEVQAAPVPKAQPDFMTFEEAEEDDRQIDRLERHEADVEAPKAATKKRRAAG